MNDKISLQSAAKNLLAKVEDDPTADNTKKNIPQVHLSPPSELLESLEKLSKER